MQRLLTISQTLSLVLFPLSFMLLSNTGLHPGFSGTAAEQIQGLAADAVRWRWVHTGLAGGSLLGLAALLTLRSLVARSLIAVNAVTAIGVVGAALLTGVFALEATLVPELAKACVESGLSCLSPANQAFLDRFTDLALNRVPLLFQSGGTLMAATFALALMGQKMQALVLRESLPLMVGSTIVFLYGPALHGMPLGLPFFGFLIMLAGSSTLAIRLLRTT